MESKEKVKGEPERDSGESLAQIHKHIATFTCRTHPAETVKCLKLSTSYSQQAPSLICFYCLLSMNENDRKSLVEIPEHLKKIIHYYNSIQLSNKTPGGGENEKKDDVPDESAILLEKGNEYVQKLKAQVETEKGTIINFIEIIKKRVLDKLDEKKNIAFKQLDDCVADVSTRINILHSNMKRLKSGISDFHTPSWETLLEKIQAVKNTTDFENLLSVYTRDIQENETLREMGPKKAKENITETLKAVQKYLNESELGEAEEIPLVNISKLSEFEKSVSDWSAKLFQSINDLPLKIQLSSPILKCFNFSKFDSLIMKDESEIKLIKEWLGKGDNVKLNLLYRGSVDGFAASDFHRQCDNKGSTLTVIESTNNKRFGGYTPLDWKSGVNNYVNTSQSWLFSLDHKEKLPQIKSPEYGMYCNDGYGPTFGGNFDLYIAANANANNTSYSTLGYVYKTLTSGNSTYLAETYNFTVKEIEVFSVSN